jgi:hypothetical protein
MWFRLSYWNYMININFLLFVPSRAPVRGEAALHAKTTSARLAQATTEAGFPSKLIAKP